MSEQELLPAVQDHRSIGMLDRLDEILLTGEMEVEIVDDPAEIQRGIIQQLLAAPDDIALQAFGNAEPWGDYLERPVELHGFRWRRSDFEEGAPVYFIVDATTLHDGERRTLTTGSMSVLAQLSNMARRGTLEGGVWLLHEAEKTTAAGFKPRWLVQPPEVLAAAKEQAAAERAAADES